MITMFGFCAGAWAALSVAPRSNKRMVAERGLIPCMSSLRCERSFLEMIYGLRLSAATPDTTGMTYRSVGAIAGYTSLRRQRRPSLALFEVALNFCSQNRDAQRK